MSVQKTPFLKTLFLLGLSFVLVLPGYSSTSYFQAQVSPTKKEVRRQKRLEKLTRKLDKRVERLKVKRAGKKKAFRDLDQNLRISLILFGAALGLALFWIILSYGAFFSVLTLGVLIAAIVFLVIWLTQNS